MADADDRDMVLTGQSVQHLLHLLANGTGRLVKYCGEVAEQDAVPWDKPTHTTHYRSWTMISHRQARLGQGDVQIKCLTCECRGMVQQACERQALQFSLGQHGIPAAVAAEEWVQGSR